MYFYLYPILIVLHYADIGWIQLKMLKQRDCMDICVGCVMWMYMKPEETVFVCVCPHVFIKKDNLKKHNKLQSQSMLWKEKLRKKKENVSFRPIFHIAASKKKKKKKTSTWIECVCAHSGGIYTGSVFISVHNEADLQLHGPERLQFSALGE